MQYYLINLFLIKISTKTLSNKQNTDDMLDIEEINILKKKLT